MSKVCYQILSSIGRRHQRKCRHFRWNSEHAQKQSTLVSAAPSHASSDHTIHILETGAVQSFDNIPGPKTLPFLGTFPYYLPGGRYYGMEFSDVSTINRERYGDIYKERMPGGVDFVNIFNPEDIEVLFRSDGKYPQREAFFMLSHYNNLHNGRTQGLLTSQNNTWHILRTNVQQKMLRPKAVAAYLPDHSIVADDLVNRIRDLCTESGELYDFGQEADKYAAECIGVVCFNTRLGAFRRTDNESEAQKFISAVRDVMHVSHMEFRQLPLYKLFGTSTFKKLVRAQSYIRELTLKYSYLALEKAEGRKERGCDVTGEQGDLVPYLMSKSSLSNEQVLTVISEFIFAGVDTTSHHTQFLLYLLACNPSKQEKLYQEICRQDDPLTGSALAEMSYLKAVTKETHRMLPVAPGNIRKTTKDIVLSGFNIPAGTTVAIHSDALGKDEKEFPQAEKFIPERWLRANKDSQSHHPYAFLPFGHGPRSCIGKRFAEQESQIAIIKIIKEFHVQYIGEKLKLETSITYKPINKMSFRFHRRSMR